MTNDNLPVDIPNDAALSIIANGGFRRSDGRPALPPKSIFAMLAHRMPDAFAFIESDVLDSLANLVEENHFAHYAAIQEYLASIRTSYPTMSLIRSEVERRLAKRNASGTFNIIQASSYNDNPPPKIQFQHPQIMAMAGTTVLGGRPKMGKSYMALNLALAISSGGIFMGKFEINHPGSVLYLALEDSESRFYERAQSLLAGHQIPESLDVAYGAPGLSSGLIDMIDNWIKGTTALSDMPPRLVVVDILGKVQSHYDGKSNLYQAEYNDMSMLNTLANDHNLHFLLVTHLNKNYSNAEEVEDAIMSSTAITGAASGIWVLTKDPDGDADGQLKVSGKDIPPGEFKLRRVLMGDHMDWQYAGGSPLMHITGRRAEILITLFKWTGQAPNRQELYQAIDPLELTSGGSFRKLINRMVDDKLITEDRNKRLTLTTLGAKEAKALLYQHEAFGDDLPPIDC